MHQEKESCLDEDYRHSFFDTTSFIHRLKDITMAIHKGTELNNVNETWKRNEELRQREDVNRINTAGTPDSLDRTIREEAAEYDRADKEERLLDGDRASVNDTADT